MVRRPLALAALAVATVLALVAASGDAGAQPSPYGAGAVEEQQRGWKDEAAATAWREAEANKSTMKEPERLTGRPSGFWTSTRPAKGGAYRWRIMAAGLFVLGITVFFVFRMLRRTAAARHAH